MSRSGYDEGCDDDLAIGRWRGVVASTIRGKRGQAFLRELIDALDELPEKRLISHELQAEGSVCAIGSVGLRRGVDMAGLDVEDPDQIAKALGISAPLVCEIEFENDEAGWHCTPEQRWQRMRRWAERNLKTINT